jgi:DNA polymerase elongation subunit (family B)
MQHNMLADIETYGIDTVGEYVERPTAPGNYKNPETIAAYEENALAKAIEKAALDPDLGRIVAIAWQLVERDHEPRVMVCRTEDDERRVITAFLDDLTDTDGGFRRLVTFNGHRFDQPFLMRRADALGVCDFPLLRCDRNSPHLDMLRVMTYDDVLKPRSLQFYLRRYANEMRARGIEVADILDDCDGSAIHQLVATNQWDAVANHCKCDVQRLYALCEWKGVIDPHVALATDKPF